MATTTNPLTYNEYILRLKSTELQRYMTKLEIAVHNGEISQAQFADTVERLTGRAVKPVYSRGGQVLAYTLEDVATVTTPNPINSNASTVSRGVISKPMSTTVSQGGKAVMQGLRGVGTKLATGAALVGTEVACVGVGISLGKTIDSLLYNANPDFWDSHGMSTLNPEKWGNLIAGDDSINASLLNMIFGFDDDGNSQAYMDAEAFAYMAAYMNSLGCFETGDYQSQGSQYFPQYPAYSSPILAEPYTPVITHNTHDTPKTYTVREVVEATSDVYLIWYKEKRSGSWEHDRITAAYISLGAFKVHSKGYKLDGTPDGYERTDDAAANTIQNTTVYTRAPFGSHMSSTPSASGYWVDQTGPTNYVDSVSASIPIMAMLFFTGTITGGEAIEGVGSQDGATLPNTSGWDDVDSTLASLQTQYPDLFSNAIEYPVIQPDGSVKNYTYLPVALPDFVNRTDGQPVSGTASQTNTEINPSTIPQNLIDAITAILANPYPQTDPDSDIPPSNPTDTGSGDSPTSIIPSGSASSLWKIYHPTQAQIDSFGAWLWSSNFIDQILKIFNNPMEAVIGLHKVYATPVDAGNTTIKVGYLDSEVPSAYVEQQYIEVSCGSVDLSEQFGNVFDYSPYTDVQLYLPFVGIVPLNVSDVMRSTISVKYGVDVITGACLAMVEVSRDACTSVLYQYSGNCAVQYPVSSGSYMGIVTSVISVAGGVAATVASGGAAAPLALGAAGGLLSAHTDIQRSGGFSGNSGAMGCKTPYLIISRPQTKLADNAGDFQGYPSNDYVTIGECSGYIKADSVHVVNVAATDEELNLINEYILNGIII